MTTTTNHSSQGLQTINGYPTAQTIYVIATSNDLQKLDKAFFRDNITIGINQSYIRAEQVGEQLTYWVCLDEFFKFFFWCKGDTSPNTFKFIPVGYYVDSRIKNLKKACREDCIRVYRPRRFHLKFRGNIDGPPVLDDLKYTIFSAVSLAVCLGAEKIVLRGVSLGGKYVDETIKMKRDSYFEDVRNIFTGTVFPALKRIGIDLVNETEVSRLELPNH